MKLKKVIVVTGANQGIGYGIIEGFCKNSDVKNKILLLTSRKIEDGEIALNKLKNEYPEARGSLFYHQLDASKGESIKNLATHIDDKFGYVNILYNNAALMYKNPSKDIKNKEIIEVFNTNVLGLRVTTEEMVPLMKQGGHVVNISAHMGIMKFSKGLIQRFMNENLTMEDLQQLFREYREAYVNSKLGEWDDKSAPYGSYGVSKVFVNAVTRIHSKMLMSKNIKVNAVAPGWTKTRMGGPQAPRDVTKGAETPIWLESFADDNNPELTGNFYYDKSKINWH
jgi:carbonyl reductase 1/carbonyl reductase 3